MKLSVVMPVYNEEATLRKVIERVFSVGLDIELLCVDDGSKDRSREILAELQLERPGCAFFCSRKIWVRAPRCAAEFRKRPATT